MKSEHPIIEVRRRAQAHANSTRRNMVIWRDGDAYNISDAKIPLRDGTIFVELVRPEKASTT